MVSDESEIFVNSATAHTTGRAKPHRLRMLHPDGIQADWRAYQVRAANKQPYLPARAIHLHLADKAAARIHKP